LWKISRQYKVKVDELVRINGLEKDSLYPGMTLKLPR
ncbi:MAG: LysM peptidoglycan-binding domain-containing protein, partial [Verrucomicrobiota bacterium]|nr:LysM peptidoglycan-binding domain-containing protein [Verrucomicrobiota bacterium]